MTTQPHNPLWTANRAFVMFEALDLAARASHGQTAWSRRHADETAADEPRNGGSYRRAAVALALLATGGLAAAGWIA